MKVAVFPMDGGRVCVDMDDTVTCATLRLSIDEARELRDRLDRVISEVRA